MKHKFKRKVLELIYACKRNDSTMKSRQKNDMNKCCKQMEIYDLCCQTVFSNE